MTVYDLDSAVGALRAVTIEVETALTADDVSNIWTLIDAGEPGVAFEVLCTQLYEYDADISDQQQAVLESVGGYFGMDPSLWEILRPSS